MRSRSFVLFGLLLVSVAFFTFRSVALESYLAGNEVKLSQNRLKSARTSFNEAKSRFNEAKRELDKAKSGFDEAKATFNASKSSQQTVESSRNKVESRRTEVMPQTTHIKEPSYRVNNRNVTGFHHPGLENLLDDDYTYCKQVAPWQVGICVSVTKPQGL